MMCFHKPARSDCNFKGLDAHEALSKGFINDFTSKYGSHVGSLPLVIQSKRPCVVSLRILF